MDEREVMRTFETGSARWILAAVVAAFLVAALIWAVASGFRGQRIATGAEALTGANGDPTRGGSGR